MTFGSSRSGGGSPHDEGELRPRDFGIVAGALAAPAAAILFWMAADDFPPARAFATPIPYAMVALCWLVAVPAYVALEKWFGLRLERFLAAGAIGALPPTLLAYSYLLTPRANFAAFILIGAALTGSFVFWACLRLSAAVRRPQAPEDGSG